MLNVYNFLREENMKIKGIILSFILAIPCYILGKMYPVIGGPVIAIIVGMILKRFIKEEFEPGIKFTSKKVLQLAVIMLGFSMNINQVLKSGYESLPVIISTISIALITAFIMCKILKMDRDNAILVGVGSSICGGSAIAATAPIINADDETIAKSISTIFLFNVLAAIIFPTLGEILNMTNEGFAIFAGTAVNDTSSVTAAAASWDAIHVSNTLEMATVVKLTRTLAIIPISIVLSIYENKKNNADKELNVLKLIPNFILFFVMFSILTTVLPIPESFISFTKLLSKFFITMAMMAIGLSTDIVNLIKTGGKSIALGFICWIAVALMSLLMQNIVGLI